MDRATIETHATTRGTFYVGGVVTALMSGFFLAALGYPLSPLCLLVYLMVGALGDLIGVTCERIMHTGE